MPVFRSWKRRMLALVRGHRSNIYQILGLAPACSLLSHTLSTALESFHPATAWQPRQETSTICLLSHQHPGPSLIGTVFIIFITFLHYDLGQDADCCQQRSRILLILDSDSRAEMETLSLLWVYTGSQCWAQAWPDWPCIVLMVGWCGQTLGGISFADAMMLTTTPARPDNTWECW